MIGLSKRYFGWTIRQQSVYPFTLDRLPDQRYYAVPDRSVNAAAERAHKRGAWLYGTTLVQIKARIRQHRERWGW